MRRALRVGLLFLVVLLGVAGAGFLVSTSAGAHALVRLLELQSAPVDPDTLKREAQAIALVGGRTSRVHHAARLHLETGLPILIVGKGTGDSPFAAESEKMANILVTEYGIRPRWVETESLNTRDNAIFAWCLLEGTGVRRLALVTDPHHIPRARASFEAVGFLVTAVPTRDRSPGLLQMPPPSLQPGREGLDAARTPLEEWAGVLLARIEGLVRPHPQCRRGEPA